MGRLGLLPNPHFVCWKVLLDTHNPDRLFCLGMRKSLRPLSERGWGILELMELVFLFQEPFVKRRWPRSVLTLLLFPKRNSPPGSCAIWWSWYIFDMTLRLGSEALQMGLKRQTVFLQSPKVTILCTDQCRCCVPDNFPLCDCSLFTSSPYICHYSSSKLNSSLYVCIVNCHLCGIKITRILLACSVLDIKGETDGK